MLYIEFVLGSRAAESISPFVDLLLLFSFQSLLRTSRTHREWEWEKSKHFFQPKMQLDSYRPSTTETN